MSTRVMVVGAGGQLGRALADGWPDPDGTVTPFTRADLDVTSAAAVDRAVGSVRPDVLVNASAYTDVDGAESDPVSALAVNAWAVGRLARAASAHDAVFVHYSTDFVFDGASDRPYTETDRPNPPGAYGASKLLGEWLAARAPRHYVLRVESLFGGPRARSSVDRMLDGLRRGQPVRAFSDRTVSPSYVDDVVAATAALVRGRADAGLYHCVNSGHTTWSGVARQLARLVGADPALIVDVPFASASLRARRPAYAALSNARLAAAGIVMPAWQDALARYVAAIARASDAGEPGG